MSEQGPYAFGRLRPGGGYRALRAFQTTTVIYDGTVFFCEKFITRRRLFDQMTEAARSGRQNIGEGSRAGVVSAESELKLVNVARASQDELLMDYEDFLRQRKLRQWKKDDPETMEVRAVAINSPNTPLEYKDYARWLDHEDPAVRANCLISLIHQANYLLDKLVTRMEKDIIQKGGYREQLTAARSAERDRQTGRPVVPAEEVPNCAECGKPMRLRTAKQGSYAGSQFWGCSGYPECKGTRKYQPSAQAGQAGQVDAPDQPGRPSPDAPPHH